MAVNVMIKCTKLQHANAHNDCRQVVHTFPSPSSALLLTVAMLHHLINCSNISIIIIIINLVPVKKLKGIDTVWLES